MIYTTHDVSTLTKETFHETKYGFAKRIGISNLYSLVEYKLENMKVRNDATYNKDYLQVDMGLYHY